MVWRQTETYHFVENTHVIWVETISSSHGNQLNHKNLRDIPQYKKELISIKWTLSSRAFLPSAQSCSVQSSENSIKDHTTPHSAKEWGSQLMSALQVWGMWQGKEKKKPEEQEWAKIKRTSFDFWAWYFLLDLKKKIV